VPVKFVWNTPKRFERGFCGRRCERHVCCAVDWNCLPQTDTSEHRNIPLANSPHVTTSCQHGVRRALSGRRPPLLHRPGVQLGGLHREETDKMYCIFIRATYLGRRGTINTNDELSWHYEPYRLIRMNSEQLLSPEMPGPMLSAGLFRLPPRTGRCRQEYLSSGISVSRRGLVSVQVTIQTVLTHAARPRSYFVAVVMIDSKKRDTHGPWAVNASAIRKTATS